MFTIPSWRDAIEDPAGLDPPCYPQAEIDPVDIDILLAGFSGRGVTFGCEVTQASPTGMLVDVAVGQVAIDGVAIDVAAQPDVAFSPANATQPRFDLVVCDNLGIIQVLQGFPADQSPPFPALPDDVAALASAYVLADLVSILGAHLVDKRVEVPIPGTNGAGWETETALVDANKTNTATLSADTVLKFSMLANTSYRFRGRFGVIPGVTTTPRVTTNPSTGAKWGLVVPGAVTWFDMIANQNAVGNTFYTQPVMSTLTGSGVNGIQGATNPAWIMIDGTITNGATPGDFAIAYASQFAVSGVSATRILGSYLEHQEVS